MAVAGGSSPLCEANLLALTGEEALEDIKELTLRNHKLHSFGGGDTERLINLQVMSLSHNLLSSLAGFQHLKHLVSLNMNFNALTSLEGIGHCTALQHLFVANNRVREVSPLVPCTALRTLHLFRNNIPNMDLCMAALAHLPKLRELELAGNPCSLAPDYKHRVVLQLELESLDGDVVTDLDYDLANEYFAANGGMPAGLGPRVDILTLEEVDPSGATGGAGQTTAAGATARASGSGDAGSSGPSASPAATDGGGADALEPGSAHYGQLCRPKSAEGAAGSDSKAAVGPSGGEAQAMISGTGVPSLSSGLRASEAATANGRLATAAWAPLPRPGSATAATAAARSVPAGPGPSGSPAPMLPRPGTATRRPGSASGRPGSAYSGLQSSVQLLSNEILNDHPLIIEYLAKHVLMEGLALTEQHHPQLGGLPGLGRPGSGGGGAGGSGRGPSFAQRLRDTAATMNACEDVDPKTLAGHQQDLIATSQTVRLGIAEEMVASASPNELCRQLVRLCEVLIKEVEACRSGRPSSSGASGRPGTSAGRPGTSAGRPGTAMGLRPGTSGLGASSSSSSVPSATVLTPAEVGELIQLRAEVERLCRENKTLRLENENMFWLVEEVKRLKAGQGASAGR